MLVLPVVASLARTVPSGVALPGVNGHTLCLVVCHDEPLHSKHWLASSQWNPAIFAVAPVKLLQFLGIMKN
jgi:hypothetical protein